MALRSARRGPTGMRRVVASGALVAALLTGCGGPEYRYVANSDDRTYVRLPHTWREIDRNLLGAALRLDPAVSEEDAGIWLRAYDADPQPSPIHLFGVSAQSPAAFISVQQVPENVRGQMSLDTLRDFFFPVTQRARAEAAEDPTSTLSDFALYGDEVLTPGEGLRGVHVVFRYRMGDGPPQVIDQTAYLNDDASMFYMFFVRCSTECYEQRQGEIEAVVSSFTVRESA